MRAAEYALLSRADLKRGGCSRAQLEDSDRQVWLWINKNRYERDREAGQLHYEARPGERDRDPDDADGYRDSEHRGGYDRDRHGGRRDGDRRDSRYEESADWERRGLQHGREGSRSNPSYSTGAAGEMCPGPGCADNLASPYVPRDGGKHPGDPRYYPYYSRGACKYCDQY